MPTEPTITAFRNSPDRGRGLARDMRVRWAFEEVGQGYGVELVTFAEMKTAAHRARHPFRQIPTYEAGDLALFESGAIVLEIARLSPGLLPVTPEGQARAIAWMFAAIGTIEPPIVEREQASYLERDRPWFADRQPLLDARIRGRLGDLSKHLGDAEWLDGPFSAGDLLMVTVLRRLESTNILEAHPNLAAYVARGEARPAYARAFAAQKSVFDANRKENTHAH